MSKTTYECDFPMNSSAASIDDPEGGNETNHKQVTLLQNQRDRLIRQVEQIRQRRAMLQGKTIQVNQCMESWMHRLNTLDMDYQRTLSLYQDLSYHQRRTVKLLENCNRWNVLNDCFYIWYRGPFGTINGLRLGNIDGEKMMDTTTTGAFSLNRKTKSSSHTLSTTTTTASPKFQDGSESDSHLSSHSSTTAAKKSNNKESPRFYSFKEISPHYESVSQSSTPTTPSNTKVTWLEINAALGLTALLLYTLQKKTECGILFSSHEIMPMGCFTKIGVKQQGKKTCTWYNLYYTDDSSLSSYLFSSKKHFNIALQGLGCCLADAVHCVQERDRTLILPYPISVTYSSSSSSSQYCEVRIDDIPIAYGNNGVVWTRVMKYFLTDLKWLLVFITKHAD